MDTNYNSEPYFGWKPQWNDWNMNPYSRPIKPFRPFEPYDKDSCYTCRYSGMSRMPFPPLGIGGGPLNPCIGCSGSFGRNPLNIHFDANGIGDLGPSSHVFYSLLPDSYNESEKPFYVPKVDLTKYSSNVFKKKSIVDEICRPKFSLADEILLERRFPKSPFGRGPLPPLGMGGL